jgi:hypothetical protein
MKQGYFIIRYMYTVPVLEIRSGIDAIVWQNRLNYTGSNTQVLFQGLQRTSNGVILWSVGSPPDTTTVQQDRRRFSLARRRVYNYSTTHHF